MNTATAPSLRQRAKRALIFVALVWGVAGSFVLFEILAVSGFARLLPYGGVGTFALPAAVTESRVCQATPERGATTPAAAPGVEVGAWNLGVQSGLHTRASLLLLGGEVSDEFRLGVQRFVDATAVEIDQLANTLQVPRPAAFVARDVVMVNTEFVFHVEGDGSHTAAALAGAYGARACELYKLGSYWGYSILVRNALAGEANIYAAEISYYAPRTGLPTDITEAMIARTPADASSSMLFADANAVTNRVAAFLQSRR